ncbi:type I restriction endonuclease MjaXP subunit S [Helicobacter cinaedi]|uniref:restriction endonuclease subunit S n=1 Tax=Helicobacter cinaedi TaxID=213 RepID=UPI001EEECD62|nr:restriction endonuclease subunit S [Helicobacter cinaedi]BDB67476.1 type I restriction endonuclease MjaXP subunit S [Helicobacter cinaedi]
MIVNLKEQHCENFLQSLHKEQWQEVRLGEVAEIIGGGTPKTSIPEYWNGEIPWLTPKDLAGYNHIYISKGERFITELGLKNSSATLMPKGTILLSSRAPIGYVAIAQNDICTNQGFKSLVVEPKQACNLFVYYWIKNNVEYLQSLGTGTTFEEISKGVVQDITIPLPPLTIQQKIAEILSSFDDKIDLLHRQNKTLESLALTLFRHYFIDNPKRDEWEEVSLDDICLKIASGGTPSTTIKEYYCGNINWYSTKEFNDNFLFNSVQTITENGLTNSSAKLFPKDTIVIAIYAAPTVGRLGILTQDSAFNQAACGLIVDETQCSKEFIFLFLKNERKNLNLLASGSAQQNLNVEKIKSYTLALPDKNSLHCFNIQAKGFFDKIYNNAKQIQNLQAMRDLMLKMIFNSET